MCCVGSIPRYTNWNIKRLVYCARCTADTNSEVSGFHKYKKLVFCQYRKRSNFLYFDLHLITLFLTTYATQNIFYLRKALDEILYLGKTVVFSLCICIQHQFSNLPDSSRCPVWWLLNFKWEVNNNITESQWWWWWQGSNFIFCTLGHWWPR